MPMFNPPSSASVAPASVLTYGRTGGRVITGQIDGTTATGAAVNQACTTFGSINIALAHLFMGQGVDLGTANSVKIVTDGLYRVTGRIRFTGGSAANRVVIVLVNGASIGEVSLNTATGAFVTTRDVMLYAGDLVTMQAYVETGSVLVSARDNQYGDVNLTVTRAQLASILPILSGWSGVNTASSAAAYNGATRDITNHWLSKNSWADLNGSSMAGATDLQYWKNNFQARAVTVGCPLIPHAGNAASTWNSLLDEVVAGTRDPTFTALGTALAQNCPNTVICRPWWEMNADLNNNAGMIDATKFANAWNRAVPLIRTAFNAAARTGQTIKFSYSYLIYLSAGNTYNEMTLYPGNTNVDVIAPDLYAQLYGTTNPSTAAVMSAVRQRLQEAAVFAAQKGKPLGLDEWGTHIVEPADGVAKVRGIGDAPTFADAVYDWAEQNQIQYMALYSMNDGAGFIEVTNYPNFLARIVARGNAVATFANQR